MADTTDMQTLQNFVKDGRTASLSTVDGDGKVVSRPMALQSIEFDGELWFFTSAKTHKVAEITANPAVNVMFESKNSWVSISSEAQILQDRSKSEELWNPFVKAYFPDGIEDPELRLVKVRVVSAEYWDSDSKPVSLVKMMKAAATDSVPDLGDNKTLEL